MANTTRLTKKEKTVEDWFEFPMLIVTLLLIVTLVTPLIIPMNGWMLTTFAVANLVIWFAYYAELIVKLAVAKNKLQGLKRNWYLVIIALSPLFLPFRFIRLGRLVSLLRLMGLQRYIKKLQTSVQELIYNVEYILGSIVIFIALAALMMWQVEVRFDGSITSLADALWWAVITITTIGYGDQVPTSPEGKVLGAFVGLFGSILFMVFIARVTTVFVRNQDIEALRREIRAANKK
jgi:voltage-gated potassium channel